MIRPLTVVLALTSLVLLSACAPAPKKNDLGAKPAPGAPPERFIQSDPRALPLNDISAIAGQFTRSDGQATSAAWSRAYDRKADDPSLSQGGALRVTIGGQLYKTVDEAIQDFRETAEGQAGREFVLKALRSRGLEDANISIEPLQFESFGVNQQAVWRAVSFQTGSPRQRFEEYWLFLRVGNTRALMTVFAPRPEPAVEPPRLRDDAIAVAKAQAAQLMALPSQPPPK